MISTVRRVRDLNHAVTDPAGPVRLMYRPGKGRWKTVDVVETYAEAVALIGTDGRHGDWWLKTLTRTEEEHE